MALLVMVYCINMVFIRKIVEPVAEVTEAVQHISSGSYGLQIENTYHEEIGALVDSINEMSSKISQNEKMQREFISSVSHELRTPPRQRSTAGVKRCWAIPATILFSCAGAWALF